VELADRLHRTLRWGIYSSMRLLLFKSVLCLKRRTRLFIYVSAVRTNVGPPGRKWTLWDLAPHDISVILNVIKMYLKSWPTGPHSPIRNLRGRIRGFGNWRWSPGSYSCGLAYSNKTRLIRMVCSQVKLSMTTYSLCSNGGALPEH
jgi:hypothetical protein